MAKTNILIVSEQAELKTQIRKYLPDDDYSVIEHRAGHEMPPKVHLIIFDQVHAQNTITSVYQQLKTRGRFIPLIAIIETSSVQSAIELMRSGASDVLTLPINKQVLLTSIKNAIMQQAESQHDQTILQQAIELLQSLRTNGGSVNGQTTSYEPAAIDEDGILELGELAINIKQEKAFYRKLPVDITPTQFRLLALLVEAKGRTLPFEELYFRLHGNRLDRSSARIALSAHLSNLRTRLSEAGCNDYLVNVRGRGYLFEIPEKVGSDANHLTFDFILQHLPILIWTTDVDLRITSIWGAALNDFNVKAEQIIGAAPQEFFQVDGNTADEVLPVAAYHQALAGESTSLRHDIRGRSFHIYFEPCFDSDADITGCIAIAVDVTERSSI